MRISMAYWLTGHWLPEKLSSGNVSHVAPSSLASPVITKLPVPPLAKLNSLSSISLCIASLLSAWLRFIALHNTDLRSCLTRLSPHPLASPFPFPVSECVRGTPGLISILSHREQLLVSRLFTAY